MEIKAILAFIKSVVGLATLILRWLEKRDWKRLGELETEKKYDKAADDALDAIVAARDKRLSDDEAFGSKRERKRS